MRIRTFSIVAVCCAAALGLSACDQQDERIERVQKLGDAVLDQLGGSEVERPLRSLDEYPVAARAMAGKIEPWALSDEPDRTQRRFVLGSLVAKPKDLPPPVEMAAVMEQPELLDEVVVDEQAEARIIIPDEAMVASVEENPDLLNKMEKTGQTSRSITVVDPYSARPQYSQRSITSRSVVTEKSGSPAIREAYRPRPLARTSLRDRIKEKKPLSREKRALSSRSITPPPPPIIELEAVEFKPQALPQLSRKVASRAVAMRTETLERQLEAEDRMIETATKYGLAAAIQRSRTGQMVIEIGADTINPTQFTAQQATRQVFGVDQDVTCDANRSNDAQVAMECVIQELESTGDFEYVEKDYLFDHQMIFRPGGGPSTPAPITPNDPLFGLQWHYANQGSEAGQSLGGAGFVDFWTRKGTQGSSDIVVAVVDTGLEMAHPDIASSQNVAQGWDMVTDPSMGNDGDGRDGDANDAGDACPEKGIPANSFHGTHVAGTIGAGITNNGDGVAGGAWNVKIVPVRALGRCGGRLSDINDAIRWAAGMIPEFDAVGNEIWNENPADIINLSIGLFKACPASMQDAIDSVTAEGVIVVAAAGNSRVSTDFYAPGGCRNVVTVAGGDARGFIAPYSNYGDAVDILAPGGDLSRDDNGDGNPDGVLSTKTATNCSDPVTGSPVSQCFYAYEQGTSMAAPHVSSALALIKSARPDLSSEETVSRLLAGATTIPEAQCAGPCSQYPGAEAFASDETLCARPCGGGLLNLAGVDLSD
ncbi:MAG: S8 family peptidase [Pseudomonadota bacterium]